MGKRRKKTKYCPYLEECEEKIDKRDFESQCMLYYGDCYLYEEKQKRTPKEWLDKEVKRE